MIKKIILHGATNWGSSNFGDFLYGMAIYNYIKKNYSGVEVGFYSPSSYFTKYIGQCKTTLSNSDLLIYIPGGYFGQSHKSRLIDNAIQFIRFMPVGIKARMRSMKISVIGIGAGPIVSPLLKKSIKMICNNAQIISTRDKESYNALFQIGVQNVIELSDLILALDLHNLADETTQIKNICANKNGKKILFVHYNHSILARDKFAEMLKLFLAINDEYQLIVGSDCILNSEEKYFVEFSEKLEKKCLHFIYDSPYELISLLEKVDAVLTCKLHVGVVATMFNKPVRCFAEHPEKTIRYYNQIGEKYRFASLYDTPIDRMLELFKTNIILKSHIPNIEIEKAQKHFKLLDQIIK